MEGETMRTLQPVKKSILFLVPCLLLLYFYNSWLTGFQPVNTVHPYILCKNSSGYSHNVTILLWHFPFGVSMKLDGDVCWDLYHIPRCRLVDQRSAISYADVVVFHNRELVMGHEKLPLDHVCPQHQRWAWMTLESPVNNGNLRQFSNIFNMTMTYRRDSDVPLPYGMILPKAEAEEAQLEVVPLNKSSLICWVVSNYQSHYKRSQVYQELSSLVPVQVYGKWSKNYLRDSKLLPTISHCYFYLAFENSIATDYITEKLWKNAFQGGAVPVVLGARLSDYRAVAPPHSFIHVDDFTSVKDLAKYLQQLAKDEKRYREYFTWKEKWEVKRFTDWRERLCQICLHFDTLPEHKVYPDLMAWMSS
ncbi:alpha-(1,3)-fucosyltransferase 7 [Cynoglossus semilaevis]|uniref:Fucosyltransferase n=1 Tax=Cynoglossus semilaevis TaxID=244447 RepID=A0A3P8WTT7_CYNSE|nr:alpha-(1,3)-fucosyltransferase 7-like [Cynoglossus semilaevis]